MNNLQPPTPGTLEDRFDAMLDRYFVNDEPAPHVVELRGLDLIHAGAKVAELPQARCYLDMIWHNMPDLAAEMVRSGVDTGGLQMQLEQHYSSALAGLVGLKATETLESLDEVVPAGLEKAKNRI